jgi:hypothetical protein
MTDQSLKRERGPIMKWQITTKGLREHTIMRFLPVSLFLIGGCVSTYEMRAVGDENRQKQISSAVLSVCVEQKATGNAGKYGFEAYVYLSKHPQMVGIDPRDELMEEIGGEKLAKYTNSDYVRFGALRDRGRKLGKLILADKTGDILKGTFCGSYDVTGYLKQHGNRRYYLATVAKLNKRTYATVGVRCLLEVSTMGGNRIRSSEVYFLARTESMNGYLAREMRNVGIEIAFDIPSSVSVQD